MIPGLFILCICACFFCELYAGTVPADQINGLEILYDTTDGLKWQWKPSYFGIEWSFDDDSNPCMDNWQGITCSTACSERDSCDIIELELNDYGLRNHLPSQLSLLSALSNLDLSANPLLAGSIPDSLGNMTTLSRLVLSASDYSGSLPSSLGNLTSLTELSIVGTNCSGTIPNSYEKLRKLNIFDISVNPQINGTFPSFLTSFNQLEELYLLYNSLTGSLPSGVGNMSSLVIFMVDHNQISGTIPENFGSLSQLAALDLSVNPTSGRVPESFGVMSSLRFLALQNMGLTGSIPDSFYSLTNLENLYLNSNSLTGSLSNDLSDFTSLYAIFLQSNQFTGFLPSGPWSHEILVIEFSDNFFSGSIPLPLYNTSSLAELNLGSNLLHSSIASSVGFWTSLTFLDLGANYFSGRLPSSFVGLTQFNTLLLSENMFTGLLSSVLNESMPHLAVIDVSSNRFSGTVNLPLFRSNSLNSIVMSKNCFSGQLSDVFCEASALQTLVISGLTSGCSNVFYLFGYIEIDADLMVGTIPSCILNMSNLEQLYVDGNGMQGKIPNIPFSSKLANLSLSHNRLTGCIPTSIQEYSGFEVLDLSYNHFKGTIQFFNTEPSTLFQKSIAVDGNRLSGLIPSSFASTSVTIDILGGNMFNCHSRATLPKSDPAVSNYICGSKKVNDPLYFVTSIVITLAMLFAVVVWSSAMPARLKDMLEHYFPRDGLLSIAAAARSFLFWSANSKSQHVAICLVSAVMANTRQIVIVAAFALIVVFAPTYLCLKLVGGFGTVTYQYGWLLGTGFMQHKTAAIILAVLWVAVILVLFVMFNVAACDPFIKDQMDQHSEKRKESMRANANQYLRYLNILTLIACNTFATLFVNGMFVIAILYAQEFEQYLMTIFLVIFKLNWNFGVIIPALNRFHCNFRLLLATLVFNVVVAPILATAAADVDCFQSMFVRPDIITTGFKYTECTSIDPIINASQTCVNSVIQQSSVSFTPPFLYSDQCGAALINNYVPVYVATQGIVPFAGWLFGAPLLAYILAGQRQTESQQSNGSSDHVPSGGIRLLKYLEAQENFVSKVVYRLICCALPIRSLSDLTNKRKSIRDVGNPSIWSMYNLKVHALNNTLKIALLVSFGFGYPPLGVILVLNIIITTLSLQLCLHFHHAQAAAIPGALKLWELIVSYELVDIYDIMLGGRNFLVILSVLFVSIFVFDMSSSSDPSLPPIMLSALFTVITIVMAWFGYMRRFHTEKLQSYFSYKTWNDPFVPAPSITSMGESASARGTVSSEFNMMSFSWSNRNSNSKMNSLSDPITQGSHIGENTNVREDEDFNPLHS